MHHGRYFNNIFIQIKQITSCVTSPSGLDHIFFGIYYIPKTVLITEYSAEQWRAQDFVLQVVSMF